MISLIATVLNEGDNIRQLLESILSQTRQPDEIVIVDGGSVDNTVAIIQGFREQLPLRLLIEPDCNISRGRNIAIEAARGDIIAVTDAGVRLRSTWLEQISEPLLRASDVDVVGGFFLADARTPFEAALGAATLPRVSEIKPESFLPSSRSIAFRKGTAIAAGLYPEWLDYCEDLIFDLRLRQNGARFVFAGEALVAFRPRSTAGKFFRQYYLYARGDGKADLWRKRHFIRYASYALLPPVVWLGMTAHPLWLGLLGIGGALYLYRPMRRLPATLARLPNAGLFVWLRCVALLPLLRAWGDVAKMLGYPAGWLWRLRHRPPDWRGGME